jgi:hypothetical protein
MDSSMSEWERRKQVEANWREKLNQAEHAYGVAFAQTRKVQAEFASMAPSDGILALDKALQAERDAVDQYARVLQTFTRLILYGEEPEEIATPASEPLKPPDDVEIQYWVYKHHGFVPHPYWIAQCRELYLGSPAKSRPPERECPPDKRKAVREAFVALGILK